MAQFLSAKEQPIDKVFSSDYVFTIPGYQRPYSWSTEQALELLEDLLSAMAEGPSDLHEAIPYFLGSIVLIKKDNRPESEVVDGQQRLTTLTILLSAIRHTSQDVDLQSEVTDYLYEKGKKSTGTPDRFRLTLRERDRDFFRNFIQKEQRLGDLLILNSRLTDVEARIKDNVHILTSRLSILSQSTLERLQQFIVTRCFLVVVSTPDLDSAYRIFGVMNSRGLDLSATDVLKADVIGNLPEELRSTYTKKWEDEEESMGRERFNDLFSHIRSVYLKAKSKHTLLKDFKENIDFLKNGLKNSPQRLMDDVILPMAEDFDQISSSQFSGTQLVDSINGHLHWLNRLEFKDWVPPALAFMVRHRNDAQKVLNFFSDLERISFSMMLRRENVNVRIRRFSEITQEIENGVNLHSVTSALQLTPFEQDTTIEVLNGPLYGHMQTRALALLLKRLDQLLSNQNAIYSGDASIEHVLPQNPTDSSEWLNWIPDARDRTLWVHRLGNLVLLSRHKNSAAQNYDFERKKKTYFSSKNGITNFALTTQVLSSNEWGISTLIERQRVLIDCLKNHWKLSEFNPLSHSALSSETPTLYLVNSGILLGTAQASGPNFIVHKGSKARSKWAGAEHSYTHLRNKLIEAKNLVPGSDQEWLEFAEDVCFESPSAASATILGRTDNGRETWKVQGTNQSFAEWQKIRDSN